MTTAGDGMTGRGPHGACSRFLTAVSELGANRDDAVGLCLAAVRALPVHRAAISVFVPDSGLEVLGASDDVAERVQWAQITLGEGPGFDAVDGPILVANLSDPATPWPTFAAEAVKHGVGAVYSLPLAVGAVRVGVLDLYLDRPGPLADGDLADAAEIADLVSTIMLTTGGGAGTDFAGASLGTQWDQPSGTREVHQATGMIVAQLGVGAGDAYVRMQAFAYAQDRMLDDVAHAVVNRRLRFDPEPDDTDSPDHGTVGS